MNNEITAAEELLILIQSCNDCGYTPCEYHAGRE
jgi:hypothetical protein